MNSRDWTKALRGKIIARVQLRPFRRHPALELDGKKLPNPYHRELAYDPEIIFTDGSRLTFSTQETEVGAYGTELTLSVT